MTLHPRAVVWALSVAMIGTFARADDMPLRKPGLWEMKMGAQGQMPAMTMQHCTDETTDKRMSTAMSPLAKDACTKNEITKTATGYAADSTCTMAGTTTISHSDITGDFNSAYTVKMTSQSKGGVAGAAGRNDVMTIEAKWLGACKPGQKAGDVVMPGGMKINIADMDKLLGKLPK